MKKHLNIFLLTLLGGSMFGQQVSSNIVQNWLKQVQTPLRLETSLTDNNSDFSSRQNKGNLVYCTPAFIATPEEMTNITIKSTVNTLFNNTSGNNIAIGYEDFTTVKPADLGRTSDYTFSFQGDTKGAYYSSFTIFIDYNQDGIFGSTGPGDSSNYREIINVENLLYNSTGVDGKTVSKKIVIPQNAVLGNTRMRIMKRQTDKKSAIHPKKGCDLDSTFGQIEDYTINITKPNVCTVTPNGASYAGTFIPTNNLQETFLKNVNLGTYADIFVYKGNAYTLDASNKNVFLSLKDELKNDNLASAQNTISWTSDRTGTIRLYLHADENCSVSSEKTDVTILSSNALKNPINEPCNIGIPTTGFLLTKELKGANNQEVALDLNAYSGRATQISGIKINLQGEATQIDFELLDNENGLPSTLNRKIVGKIVSKTSKGTINGKPSYVYDVDFDKPIDLNVLELQTDIKKWLKLVTDAQTVEVNSNYASVDKMAIKNTNENQGKWLESKNMEVVYQLKATCQYNMCNQSVPENPKLGELEYPLLDVVTFQEMIFDIVAEKGKKLEVSGFDIDAWYFAYSMKGEPVYDLMPKLKLQLLENNPKLGLPYNKEDKKGVLDIEISTLDTVNVQSLYYPSDEFSVLFIKKKLKIKFKQPAIIDGDINDKYWMSLTAQNLVAWDSNLNAEAVIGSFPQSFQYPAGLRPNDSWRANTSEVVYKLYATCTKLGTVDQETMKKTKVYPNPFNNQITIESLVKLKEIEVFNLAGLKVLSKSVNDYKVDINLSNVPKGVYVLRYVDDKGKIETQKIIKK